MAQEPVDAAPEQLTEDMARMYLVLERDGGDDDDPECDDIADADDEGH